MKNSVEFFTVPITLKVDQQRKIEHTELPVVKDQLSVTLRLKLQSYTYVATIFHKGTGDLDRTPGLWLTKYFENQPSLYARFTGNWEKNTGIDALKPVFSLNEWHHLAYTLSDSEKRLDIYIDGVWSGYYSIQNVKTQNIIFNDGPLYIGKAYLHNGIDGEISNFRYFNWRLSAEEVKEDFDNKGDKIKELLEKNKIWSEDKNKNDKELFVKLQEQHPKVLWIGCVDSRVPPELITQSGFGELFVHRNVANQFNPHDANCMSALEYAVNHLKVSHIVICGHTGCGGVKNCFESNLEPNLTKWLKGIRDLESINPEFSDNNPHFETPEVQHKLVKANAVKQTEKLRENHLVKSAKHKIQIHAFVFNLKDGLLETISKNTNQ